LISVFFCTMDTKPNDRMLMSALCQERWNQESVRFHRITPGAVECRPIEFQRMRRIYAEQHADSSVYVVADDDCLLGKESPIAPMLALMEKYPEFGMLSLLPANAAINEWTPEFYVPESDANVMEHVSVGGIRFCRKGVVKNWPAADGPGYDFLHSEAIRKAGFRAGYARSYKMNHIGEGFSTVWP
jgi:hypothetical protein